MTGLGKNTIKEIDLQRLKDKYTVDGKTLRKPERQARILAIDEFKLHDLAKAYRQPDESAMAKDISEIMDICEATENSHLLWFRGFWTATSRVSSPMLS